MDGWIKKDFTIVECYYKQIDEKWFEISRNLSENESDCYTWVEWDWVISDGCYPQTFKKF